MVGAAAQPLSERHPLRLYGAMNSEMAVSEFSGEKVAERRGIRAGTGKRTNYKIISALFFLVRLCVLLPLMVEFAAAAPDVDKH